MPIKLNGSTSGYTQVNAAAVAASNTLTLPASNGALVAQSTTTAPTNGQIPIGNGTEYTAATITQGTGITVTNGAGTITIASTVTGVTSDRQVFNASGTWTKPSSGTYVNVQIWGSGGGGGGSGTSNNSKAGGAGGGYSSTTFLLSDLSAVSTVSVTINAGGTGNTGSGTAGGAITFGSYLTHTGGGVSSVFSVGCNTYTAMGRSGYISSQSGITLIEGSVEFSALGNGSQFTQESTSAIGLGFYRLVAPNIFAPGHGGFGSGNGGSSTFGGAGGAYNSGGNGGAGTAPGGGGGGSTSNTGGNGAIGRVIVTVY